MRRYSHRRDDELAGQDEATLLETVQGRDIHIRQTVGNVEITIWSKTGISIADGLYWSCGGCDHTEELEPGAYKNPKNPFITRVTQHLLVCDDGETRLLDFLNAK